MILNCLYIFFARFLDVIFGTIKTYYIIDGKKILAAILAFFEIFIWFNVAKKALINTNSTILIAIIYSLGYAVGTYFGVLIKTRYLNR